MGKVLGVAQGLWDCIGIDQWEINGIVAWEVHWHDPMCKPWTSHWYLSGVIPWMWPMGSAMGCPHGAIPMALHGEYSV